MELASADRILPVVFPSALSLRLTINPSSFTPPFPSLFLSSEIRFVNSATVIPYGATFSSLRSYRIVLITASCPDSTPSSPATSFVDWLFTKSSTLVDPKIERARRKRIGILGNMVGIIL
nr:hypothetical protein Iba_chr13cCG7250 [Ipomoea batatas]